MPSEADKLRIDKYRAGADEALELAREAAAQAREDLANGKVRDPGKLAQNAAIASGVLLDKARVLNGEPTEIVHTEDPRASALALGRMLGIVIDTTAEDLPPELPASQFDRDTLPTPQRN